MSRTLISGSGDQENQPQYACCYVAWLEELKILKCCEAAGNLLRCFVKWHASRVRTQVRSPQQFLMSQEKKHNVVVQPSCKVVAAPKPKRSLQSLHAFTVLPMRRDQNYCRATIARQNRHGKLGGRPVRRGV